MPMQEPMVALRYGKHVATLHKDKKRGGKPATRDMPQRCSKMIARYIYLPALPPPPSLPSLLSPFSTPCTVIIPAGQGLIENP